MKKRFDSRGNFHVDGWVDWDGTPHYGDEVLKNVHPYSACSSRGYCAIHHPTNHHMRDWDLIWNRQETQLERLCPHDLSHPDPDDLRYWVEARHEPWKAQHVCDGCCKKEEEES